MYIIGLIILAEVAFLGVSYIQEKEVYSNYYSNDNYYEEYEQEAVEYAEEEVVEYAEEVEVPSCPTEFILLINETDFIENDNADISNNKRFTIKNGHLDLRRMRLQGVPTSVPEETCITSIDLEHNIIDIFPTELSRLPDLQYLTLAHNNITEIEAFGALYTLKHLDLSSNNLSEVPPIGYLKNLESLNLRGNYGLSYSNNIQKLGNLPLQNLDIRYTNLAKNKAAITELKELLPNTSILY